MIPLKTQYLARPPDMSNTAPVLNELAAEQSHKTIPATSATLPRRFSGLAVTMAFTTSGPKLRMSSVSIGPGADSRTARLATDLCTAVPSGRRSAGANSVPARSHFNSDDGAIPRVQAAFPRWGQRSHRSGAGFVLMIGVAGKSYTLADLSGQIRHSLQSWITSREHVTCPVERH
jgi:hypothetical protein